MSLLKAQRLAGVHPDLVRIVMEAAPNMPFNVVVLEGVRTLERQKLLVASGASETLDSRHLVGVDGLAHAVDLAPMLDTDGDGDQEVSWHWPHYFQLAPVMKAAAAKLGIQVEWGGDWEKFKDGPHWQLPKQFYP